MFPNQHSTHLKCALFHSWHKPILKCHFLARFIFTERSEKCSCCSQEKTGEQDTGIGFWLGRVKGMVALNARTARRRGWK